MFSILNTMVLLISLLQVLFVAALGSPASNSSEGINFLDIIRALDAGDDERLDRRLASVEEEQETYPLRNNIPVIISGTAGPSRGRICFDKLPFCISFSGTMRVDDSRKPGIKSAIRAPRVRSHNQVCYGDFAIQNCEGIGLNSKTRRANFSKMIINDFCTPGTAELGGSLDIGQPLTSGHVVLASFRNVHRINVGKRKRSLKPCPGWDYCLLLSVDNILKWNRGCGNEEGSLPCQTPVRKSTYSLNDVKINLPGDPFEGSPLLNGAIFGKIVVYVDNGPLSCAYVSFRRFERDFHH